MELYIYQGLIYGIIITLGACIFSFLNVIVYRVPRKMSFVKGFSQCPSCGHRLHAPDLVPVFSYLFLAGKCRYCKERIGIRDTLVELFGGLTALFCFLKYDEYGAALTVFAFLCILTVVTLMDIDTMEIEDGCWIGAAVLAVAAVFTMPGITVLERLAGAACVSIPMLLLCLVFPGAFGGGDIKLMAGCGLFLGWKLTFTAAALAILSGGLYGIWLLASGRKDRQDVFAFGPFLCLGMAVAVFWGESLIRWYLELVF